MLDTTSDDKCFYCNSSIGLLEPYFKLMKAIKPKGQRNRYIVIGKVCEECESSNKPLLIEHKNDSTN